MPWGRYSGYALTGAATIFKGPWFPIRVYYRKSSLRAMHNGDCVNRGLFQSSRREIISVYLLGKTRGLVGWFLTTGTKTLKEAKK